ncbi:MAG: hypothetical protein JJ971_05940 [Balneolaceae bacterium]|nr:hypothetical protein [Balneolaceae bacterium]MBO6545918.1 hypothetical protein [Balneolaceae bacterium]MBO6647314.1 hypothetical protein [Balneolaceae bacterium]
MFKKSLKILCWIFFASFVIISCGKDSNPISINAPDDDGNDPPINEPDPITVSLQEEQPGYQPGAIIQFNVFNTVLVEETYTLIANDSIEFEMTSFKDSLGGQHLLFLVQEISPLQYEINFEAVGSESVISITVDEYEEIPDPQGYINNTSSEVITALDEIIIETTSPDLLDTLNAVKLRLELQLEEVAQLPEEDQVLLARIINQLIAEREQQKRKVLFDEPINCEEATEAFDAEIKTTIRLVASLGTVTAISATVNPLIGLVAGTFSLALLHQDIKQLYKMTNDFIDLCYVAELTILNPVSKMRANNIEFREFSKRTFSFSQQLEVDPGFQQLLDKFQQLLYSIDEYMPGEYSTVPEPDESDLVEPIDLGEGFVEFEVDNIEIINNPSSNENNIYVEHFSTRDSLITVSWTFGSGAVLPIDPVEFQFDVIGVFDNGNRILQDNVTASLRYPEYNYPEDQYYEISTSELARDTLYFDYVSIPSFGFVTDFGTLDEYFVNLINNDLNIGSSWVFSYSSKFEAEDHIISLPWYDVYDRSFSDGSYRVATTQLYFKITADSPPVAERIVNWREANRVYFPAQDQYATFPSEGKLDIEGTSSYEIVSGPENGTFEFSEDEFGAYSYAYEEGFAGFDSVVYRVTNSKGSDESSIVFDLYNVPLEESDIEGRWRFYVGTYQNTPFGGSTPECSERESHDPLELVAFDPWELGNPTYVEYSEAYQTVTFNSDKTVNFVEQDCSGNVTNEYSHDWRIRDQFWLQYGTTRFPIRRAINELNVTFRENNTFIKMVKVE